MWAPAGEFTPRFVTNVPAMIMPGAVHIGADGGDRHQGGGQAPHVRWRPGGGTAAGRGVVPVGRRPGHDRVVCDWIQYKANFRETAMVRPLLADGPVGAVGAGAAAASPVDGHELAVDLRRCAQPETDVAAEVTAAILDTNPDRVWLEPWVASSASCVWRFNALFWQHLVDWEKVTGKEYEQTLPGGESDGRNAGAARETILDLFKIWDELASRRALPDELYVLELGVGNGGQARSWLDEFTELDRRHGRDYYRRLRYLMGDYSAHVLERARTAVAHHGDHVSGLVLDATRLSGTIGFLAGKTFLVYISNVYDNLPSDEVAAIRGRVYLVQARSFPARSGGRRDRGPVRAAPARARPARPAAAADRTGAAGGVAAGEVRRHRARGAVLAGGLGGAAAGRAVRSARGPRHLPDHPRADRGDPPPVAHR